MTTEKQHWLYYWNEFIASSEDIGRGHLQIWFPKQETPSDGSKIDTILFDIIVEIAFWTDKWYTDTQVKWGTRIRKILEKHLSK